MKLKWQGFTLIEVLISLVVFSVIAAIVSLFLKQGFSNYFENRSQSVLQGESHLLLSYLNEDLQNVRTVILAQGNDLEWISKQNEVIRYQQEDASSTLFRAWHDEMQPLSKQVKRCVFRYFDQSGEETTDLPAIVFITLSLALEKDGKSFQTESVVYLRA